ncbi:unnamed protein product [Cylicocyclus nassatus]|uniref:Uncharacterized protein n=1 Tax=Cylicocyclus nassatus TaxID=53992 RepID=A0AA36MD09_CYLNA|nr:unnamed protein product [Cylicocyclus nassatus]
MEDEMRHFCQAHFRFVLAFCCVPFFGLLQCVSRLDKLERLMSLCAHMRFEATWILVLIYCVTFFCLVHYISKHDDLEQLSRASGSEHDFKFSHFNQTFFATDVLTTYPIKLEERMKCNVDAKASPKLILSWNAGFSQENLGGCPDWNCRLIDDKDKIKEDDAV